VEQVDVTIIGAGVIGLAVAAELSQRWPQAVIALLEKNQRWGMETSSRNSEVIHAGLYYPASSLKTKLCRQGNSLLYDFCSRTGVAHRRTGKLVVALVDEEITQLEELFAHAELVGARIEWLTAERCRELEPMIPAKAGIYSPDTGIVDSESLMRALHTAAKKEGVAMLWATPVLGAHRNNYGYQLETPREIIDSRIVINCAGLYSGQVASWLDVQKDKPAYQLHYCKGEYYCLRRPLPISHLVYPLPGSNSLGVHLTMDLEGKLRLGPNAYYIDEIDYGMDESYAEEFYLQAAAMLPGLTRADIIPGYAGIRPKLQAIGQPFSDFVINDEQANGTPGWINLVGIESPGLTACLAIAREVARLVTPYL